jgi:uncharacterized protein (TIGR03435 family)
MSRLLTMSMMVWTVAALAAQSPSVAADVFEVASIRPNNSGGPNMSLRRPPGSITATNTPASALILMAYQLQPFQLDGPDWLTSARFDVTARMPEGSRSGPEGVNAALRALLADRFKLVARLETRERPAYALVLAHPDGRLGPSLKRSAIDCEARRREGVAAQPDGRPAPPPLPQNMPESVACGLRNTANRMQFGGYPLALFVNTLANELGRVVIDRTGLTGAWTFDMTYTRIRQPRPGAEPPPASPDAPSIFTALQEQLGLKIEPTRAPVPMLVVERVEPPTPD